MTCVCICFYPNNRQPADTDSVMPVSEYASVSLSVSVHVCLDLEQKGFKFIADPGSGLICADLC